MKERSDFLIIHVKEINPFTRKRGKVRSQIPKKCNNSFYKLLKYKQNHMKNQFSNIFV